MSASSDYWVGQYAHRNRLSPTDSEAKLWSVLRCRQLGVQFRRQVPLAGHFVVDFFAPSARLVIEVDGGYHAGRQHADTRRDEKLRRLGYRVLRLDAELVLRDLPVAVECVRRML